MNAAMMTLLGSLPVATELHFFWKDGRQHLKLSESGKPDTVYALNRKPDGSGVAILQSLH
jgi:hypothetical protein